MGAKGAYSKMLLAVRGEWRKYLAHRWRICTEATGRMEFP
jgi:hypothetical protein